MTTMEVSKPMSDFSKHRRTRQAPSRVRRIFLCTVLLTLPLSMWNCGTILKRLLPAVDPTRYETDMIRRTKVDTLIVREVRNEPGTNNNGVVFPTTRSTRYDRSLDIQDTLIIRRYPNFIRLGAYESMGLLFTSSMLEKIGGGIFGMHTPIDNIAVAQRDASYLFSGTITRIGIVEKRLRWFNNPSNWSAMIIGYESLKFGHADSLSLSSYSPFYVRKRWFLRDEIPYGAIVGSFGFGLFPSVYLNGSVSAELGSIGGLNLRAYLGYAFGQTNVWSALGIGNVTKAHTVSRPYFGFSASVLDFVNKEEETEQEWKFMAHSAWNVGLLQVALINTSADVSLLDGALKLDSGAHVPLSGFLSRLAPASVALPIPGLNNRLYLGTSLANLNVFGWGMISIAYLPIRIGWWQVVLPKQLVVEPFFEYSYLPMSSYHLGVRLNLELSMAVIENISLNAGYFNGESIITKLKILNDLLGAKLAQPIDTFYIGLGFGIPLFFEKGYSDRDAEDRMFHEDELRYNRKSP